MDSFTDLSMSDIKERWDEIERKERAYEKAINWLCTHVPVENVVLSDFYVSQEISVEERIRLFDVYLKK